MSVHLTEAAARHFRAQAEKEGHPLSVRLGVRRSGCSGWMYTVDYDEAAREDDTIEDHDGVRVLISRKSLPFLDGMELDFVRVGLSWRLDFRNPNVSEACGCGESFTV